MEELITLLVGDSTTIDIYFIARVIVFCVAFDFIAIVFKYLGRFR